MTHPYQSAPTTAFWRREITEGFDPSRLVSGAPLLTPTDRVASAGSCFAANLVPYLERAGFEYVRTERRPAILGELADEAFAYSKFSAAYGNIYTPRQAAQLLLRALGRFSPAEDRWADGDGRVVDPFRPGLRHAASSDAEFDLLTRFHLARVLDAVRGATVFVLTLGLTEAWASRRDGAVFPACPGTVAGAFDAEAHEFHNFGVDETTTDLERFIGLAREVNPALRFIITVSPVPLVATATGEHVLTATAYSKAVLRVAAAEVVRRAGGCVYFPAYEIVTGPQAPHDFFEPDRRQPTAKAIDAVMSAFLSACDAPSGDACRAPSRDETDETDRVRRELSREISAAACEEEASGR